MEELAKQLAELTIADIGKLVKIMYERYNIELRFDHDNWSVLQEVRRTKEASKIDSITNSN